MRDDDRHLSDEALVLFTDGEAGGAGPGAAAHLASCQACLQRAHHLSIAMAEFATWAAEDVDEPAAAVRHARTRVALSARLQGAVAERARSWPERLRDALAPGAMWAPPVAALLLLTVWLAGRPASVVPPLGGSTGGPRALPVASITPGAVRDVRLDELCSGVSGVRSIPDEMRRRVLSDYAMLEVPADQYELDYLITPELGGATDHRNLWPQRYGDRTWNALVKDEIEQLLPRLVCSHEVELSVAQHDIAADWIAAYRKYFRTSEPLPTRRSDVRRYGNQRPADPGAWRDPSRGVLRLASLRVSSIP